MRRHTYEEAVREQEVARRRQQIRQRAVLFWCAVPSFVLLTMGSLAVVVSTALSRGEPSTRDLAVMIGGLTAQFFSVVLIVSRSLFPGAPRGLRGAPAQE